MPELFSLGIKFTAQFLRYTVNSPIIFIHKSKVISCLSTIFRILYGMDFQWLGK
ncbi:Uncharacterised protein [Legionella wadsworthii]|uniref:Uncharacterized protein n=1 Tax=Legionella wadsworthii TaxID=28088 RepID=A0A378LRK7_9GAMM|nr:Uncharacterised protein [Legionella wadsworthii]